MKIVYMGIWRTEEKPAVELCSVRDLSSYSRFTRGTIDEFLTFFTRTFAERTVRGERNDIHERSHVFHTYGRPDGVCGIIVTDEEYPIAQALLSKICDEFLTKYPRTAVTSAAANSLSYPELKDHMVQYQDPQQADSILKIQRELDETKVVLQKTIDSVLQRGEKIDTLVQKSDGLSAQSKMFYTQAKKQNSCCIVM